MTTKLTRSEIENSYYKDGPWEGYVIPGSPVFDRVKELTDELDKQYGFFCGGVEIPRYTGQDQYGYPIYRKGTDTLYVR